MTVFDHFREEFVVRKLHKVAAAGLAGLLASLLTAAPAFAVEASISGGTINLTTDSGIPLGTVWTNYINGSSWDLWVCDWYEDGYYITARVDPGQGRALITYNSQGVGEANCYHRTISYGIRKYQLLWKDFASGWTNPQ
jgi:hypothetical protein